MDCRRMGSVRLDPEQVTQAPGLAHQNRTFVQAHSWLRLKTVIRSIVANRSYSDWIIFAAGLRRSGLASDRRGNRLQSCRRARRDHAEADPAVRPTHLLHITIPG